MASKEDLSVKTQKLIFTCAFLWGILEATVFFIVPDVLLTAVAIRSLKTALQATMIVLFGAILGGSMIYWYAFTHPQAAYQLIDSIPWINALMIEQVNTQYLKYSYLSLIMGGIIGIPYKIYAYHAGFLNLPFMMFLCISIIARVLRFLLSVFLAAWISKFLSPIIGIKKVYGVWLVFYIALYGVYWDVF